MLINLAGLFAASTLAVAGGIHLGRSTIAEINPVYFSSPESTRFFTDLIPPGYDPDVTRFAEADGSWASRRDFGDVAQCQGCDPALHGQMMPDPEMPGDVVKSEHELPDRGRAPDTEFDVDRYAYFPITREEAQRSTRAGPRARIVVETAQTANEHVEAGEAVGM
jgi:hypothetical protein